VLHLGLNLPQTPSVNQSSPPNDEALDYCEEVMNDGQDAVVDTLRFHYSLLKSLQGKPSIKRVLAHDVSCALFSPPKTE
jgi:hypothetical protein